VPNSDSSPRWALVTGGYSALGLELSRLLAQDGYNLVLVERDEPQLSAAARELEDRYRVVVLSLPADLADPASPVHIADWLAEHSINCEILVNGAGFDIHGPFCRTELGRELDMMQVHVQALVKLTKHLLPGMLERRRGRILNLGSAGSLGAGPLHTVYRATQAFVLHFSQGLAAELAGSGVSVTCLCAAAEHTELHSRAAEGEGPLWRQGGAAVEQLARAGYLAMQRGRCIAVIGGQGRLLSLLRRILPRVAASRPAGGLVRSS